MDYEDKAKFDAAAAEAANELQLMRASLTKEELAGIMKIVLWWKKNFMRAGHKRLAQILTRFN